MFVIFPDSSPPSTAEGVGSVAEKGGGPEVHVPCIHAQSATRLSHKKNAASCTI